MAAGATARGDVLSRRALNRATLDRQLLLARQRRPVAATVEHLVGMQAQAPLQPYVGLWSRLDGFDPAELGALVSTRAAVRVPLMRATIHLVTAADALGLRPAMQPVLARTFASGSPYGRALAGLDLTEVLETARTQLDERPRSRAELRELLSARWPGYDANSLAQAVTYLEPVVQVPPRGVWGEALQAVWARLEMFLDRPRHGRAGRGGGAATSRRTGRRPCRRGAG